MSEPINENQNKSKRLGRGLGSLLGGGINEDIVTSSAPTADQSKKQIEPNKLVHTQTTEIVSPESRVWQIAIDKIQSGEYQPRQNFEKEKLQELAQSIKQSGILQPIVARRLSSGKFEIIAGERRWRAAQLAGLHEVPVILKTISNQETLELAIVENLQREDLNAIEEAEAFDRLQTEFNLTQQEVADKVGKERATVANSLRLLALPETIKSMVARGSLSAGHAKVLLSVKDTAKMQELAKQMEKEPISVRKLEKLVSQSNTEPQEAQTVDKINETARRLVKSMEDDLQKALGTKVGIEYNAGKGKISIQFYSNDELTQVVERLKESCLN